MIQLVVFDFDGTLADSFPWFTAELNAVARDWGFRQVAPEDAARFRRLGADAIFRELQVPRWKIPWIARDLRRRMARDIDRIALFDGIPTLLRQLSASERCVAITSSNALDNIRTVLGEDLSEGIRAFECGAALNGKAPRLKRLSRRFGVATAAILYIGDEVRDIAAARRAGAQAGAVTWGYNCASVLRDSDPDWLFQTVSEIGEQLGVSNQPRSAIDGRAAPSA